jgi:hypothetical protein
MKMIEPKTHDIVRNVLGGRSARINFGITLNANTVQRDEQALG